MHTFITLLYCLMWQENKVLSSAQRLLNEGKIDKQEVRVTLRII